MFDPPVLIIAAHPDDEILGSGGVIARLARIGADPYVLIIGEGVQARSDATPDQVRAIWESAVRAIEQIGARLVPSPRRPDNRLDQVARLDLARDVEQVVREVRPQTVLTHHLGDLNVDHRRIAEAVRVACRPAPHAPPSVAAGYAFEVASSTEWGLQPFTPDTFVEIEESDWIAKIEALRCYRQEMRPFPHPRSVEYLTALATIRGGQAGFARAEAFQTIWRRIAC